MGLRANLTSKDYEASNDPRLPITATPAFFTAGVAVGWLVAADPLARITLDSTVLFTSVVVGLTALAVHDVRRQR